MGIFSAKTAGSGKTRAQLSAEYAAAEKADKNQAKAAKQARRGGRAVKA